MMNNDINQNEKTFNGINNFTNNKYINNTYINNTYTYNNYTNNTYTNNNTFDLRDNIEIIRIMESNDNAIEQDHNNDNNSNISSSINCDNNKVI